MKNKTIIAVAIAVMMFGASRAHALQLGELTFSGEFTQNHLFDYNDRTLQPFGTFGNQTVLTASGIFDGFVNIGAILPGEVLWMSGDHLPIFSIGGYTLTNVLGVVIFGSNGVMGDVNVDGHGFVMPLDAFAFFEFGAPSGLPLDHDITAPIALRFSVVQFVPKVADGGSSFILMMIAGVTLIAVSVALDIKRVNKQLSK